MKIDLSDFGYRGTVCIMECTKETDKYKGFTLKTGYLYGADSTGSFVCPRMRDAYKKYGTDVRVFVWRLHSERGWVQNWESSATVRALLRYMGIIEKKPPVSVKRWDKYPQNALAFVHKPSLKRVFC